MNKYKLIGALLSIFASCSFGGTIAHYGFNGAPTTGTLMLVLVMIIGGVLVILSP